MNVEIMSKKESKEFISDEIDRKIDYLTRVIDEIKLKVIDLEALIKNKRNIYKG